MRKHTFKFLQLGSLAGLAFFYGCASQPPVALGEAREAVEAAKNDPQIARMAPVELHEAGKTLAQAEQTWSESEDATEVSHLAYLTKRQVELANFRAERDMAEETISKLTEQRKQLLLEARTREALMARGEAEQASEKVRQLEGELADLQAKQTERGLEITLGDILFETAKAELKPGAMQKLYRLVTVLKENPTRRLVIEGHTDSVGSETYNLQLSQRRARSVADFLIQNGVDRDRITTEGYGEAYPIAPNDTASGRQHNRRVEVIILKEGQTAEDIRRE